ncbi:hypothetical protein, partial [Streptomyces sp. GbtcB7]|uniref:hypothetical protein n=1 Tax=Streptomyces sp. GbtcB7 TaxID=2824752 RepID=UPI001C2F5EDC
MDQTAGGQFGAPDEHAEPDTELGRGKPGAPAVPQRLAQVANQSAQLTVEVDNQLGGHPQNR